jgi:branched-chain amino acid transport system substrate-binding protein
MQEMFFEEAPSDEPYDFSDIFEKIRENNVDLILYPGLPGPVIAYLTQTKEAGVEAQLVGGDAFTGLEITDENRRLFDSVQFSFQPDPADDRRNKKLTQMYVDRGYYPESFTFYSYAAVQIWSQAVERAGSLEAAAIADALRAHTFDSVLGEVTFDAKGDISNPGFVMYFFNKGKRYYVE